MRLAIVVAVSYTHLDVYKRQVLAILVFVVVTIAKGVRIVPQGEEWIVCLLYTSRCV